jgi:23S rRNA (cytidine1920-2'-O)/16S rRNA (cytidine1409-2'-O)-methyltransferase
MRSRLDREVFRRGLARSREHAIELIESGLVLVSGIPVKKPSSQVDGETSIILKRSTIDYVSRGAYKLAGALSHFTEISLQGKVVLDAGASTGGFTDLLIQRGVDKVFAVDVGYGQLAWRLQSDPKVVVKDRLNIRYLSFEDIGELVDLVVADLSFISLTLVLEALINILKEDGEMLLMVKPQFEVGKDSLGSGGVVKEPELRKLAVMKVLEAAQGLGLACLGVVASPLPGPSGNVEYFLRLKRGINSNPEAEVDEAIAKGPQ